MKKVLALMLCAALVFVLAACGNGKTEEDVRGTITSSAAKETSSEEEKEFSLGETSGTKYENKFIGIGCKLDSDWIFYTDEQIKELNEQTLDAVGDDAAEIIENTNIIYDMYATHTNGMNNMNVNLEKIGKANSALVDTKTRLQNTVPTIEEAFKNMGFADFKSEATKVKIGNKEFDGLNIQATASGIDMYQTAFIVECGEYLANFTVCTFQENDIQDILDKFYLVD